MKEDLYDEDDATQGSSQTNPGLPFNAQTRTAIVRASVAHVSSAGWRAAYGVADYGNADKDVGVGATTPAAAVAQITHTNDAMPYGKPTLFGQQEATTGIWNRPSSVLPASRRGRPMPDPPPPLRTTTSLMTLSLGSDLQPRVAALPLIGCELRASRLLATRLINLLRLDPSVRLTRPYRLPTVEPALRKLRKSPQPSTPLVTKAHMVGVPDQERERRQCAPSAWTR